MLLTNMTGDWRATRQQLMVEASNIARTHVTRRPDPRRNGRCQYIAARQGCVRLRTSLPSLGITFGGSGASDILNAPAGHDRANQPEGAESMRFPSPTRVALRARTRGLARRANIDTARPHIPKTTGLPLRHVQVIALAEPVRNLNEVHPDGVDL